MTAAPEPLLSVVIVTRDDYRPLRPIVASLKRQTIAGRIELIVVAPSAASVAIPAADARPFQAARVVGVGPVVSRGRAAAHGVRAAAAAIVALTENHCYPEPEWAERVVAGHGGNRAAVGPAIDNANPETVISRALHAFGYGPFPRTRPAADVAELPLHNSSYRKELLPTDSTDLEAAFADEPGLQRALRDRGHELRFDPAPVKWHVNESTWGRLIRLGYESGHRYGGVRGRGWPVWKRLLYVAATPVLSGPIARSIWVKASFDRSAKKGVGLAATVWLLGFAHAVGEAIAYVAGPKSYFAFLENEEFLITERLGGRPLRRPELARLVSLLDGPGAEGNGG